MIEFNAEGTAASGADATVAVANVSGLEKLRIVVENVGASGDGTITAVTLYARTAADGPRVVIPSAEILGSFGSMLMPGAAEMVVVVMPLEILEVDVHADAATTVRTWISSPLGAVA
jgi:hypothetical protein